MSPPPEEPRASSTPPRPGPIRVVLADDHLVVRKGLRALLESLGGFEVVGEAGDGEQAVREVQLLRPDVVVMDLFMPGVDGVEATRRIRAACPTTNVLVLSMADEDAVVLSAMRAGARGYLLKGAGQEELERALRAVVAGEAIFAPGVAARLLDRLAGGTADDELPFPTLTAREREVLELVARGQRNAVVGQSLGLAAKTVANHLSSIFVKLQVTDRSEAIVRAREGGLGGGP
ncbi:MAG: response regulator transcription factor [Nocardioides sp.]